MLGGRAGEVDLELVSGDRHGRPQLEVSLLRFEDVARLEPAVRKRGDRSSNAPLGVVVQFVHRRDDELAPAARAELFEAAGGEPGARGRNLVNGEEVPAKVTRDLAAGHVVRIETPGGGGFGSS